MSTFTADNGTQTKTYTQTIAVAAQSGLTFSASLPDGTVGTAYSGSVTITRQANCSGAVTITVDGASSLPAGLSLGTTIDNGDDTFTAAVTGTPTTGGTVSTTFDATDGVQTATPLVHSFTTASGSTSPVIELKSGQATGSTAATATLTDVQVGDQIFVLGIQITATPHAQIFTDTAGNTYSVQSLSIAKGAGYALVTAAAVAASLTVSYTQSSGTSNRDIVVYHLRGISAAVDTADVISAGSVSNPNGTTTNFSVTAPAKALVVMALGVITNAGDNPTVVVDEMPGEVGDFTDSTSTFNEYLVAHMQSDAGYSAQNVGFHCSVQTSDNTSNTYVAVPLSWS